MRRATRLRLINHGVPKAEAEEAAKLFHKDLVERANYIHEIKLGPFAEKMQARLKAAKNRGLSTIAIEGGYSAIDRYINSWQRALSKGEQVGFLEHVKNLEKKPGGATLNSIEANPGVNRERVTEADSVHLEQRPFPDVLTALESYGAQVQHFAYRSRMDHSYEMARSKIKSLREAAARSGNAKERKLYMDNLDALKDYIDKHQADVLLSKLTQRDEKWRNVFHSALAFQTFSKIGFNLKTVTQNTSQLFMLFSKYGIAGIREGMKYASSEEGKRLMREQALDWDSSTASYLVHQEDALFKKYLKGVRPDRWDEKLMNVADFLVSKTGSLWMLGKSELKLHEIAFATAFKRARDNMGQDPGLKTFFEQLPNYIDAMEATRPDMDRVEFLRKFNVTEAELKKWNDMAEGAEASVNSRQLWESKLESFLSQRAIDVAHDARIFVNGDYSTAGRPELFRTNWGKLIFQFKLFDVIFTNYVGQSFKQLGARLGKGAFQPIEGEDRAKILGLETPNELAWAGRMSVLLSLLGPLSGMFNTDITGWMEPGTVRLMGGLADWVSDDVEKQNYAFYGKGPASQFTGPLISDVMDAVHWSVFSDLEKDNEIARFFFGTQVWDRTPEWKQEKQLLRKFNGPLATLKYNAAPLAERGQIGQALWSMGFTPAFEKRDQFKELEESIARRQGAIDTLEKVIQLGRPFGR
jgi:hypothetical protein